MKTIAILLLAALSITATIRNPASLSVAHVQAAIDLCSAGDTVQLPSGSVTWGDSVVIKQEITFRGAGYGKNDSLGQMTDSTVIVYGNLTNYTGAVNVTTSSDTRAVVRISNIKFDYQPSSNDRTYAIRITSEQKNLWIDSCVFTSTTNNRNLASVIKATNYIEGLISKIYIDSLAGEQMQITGEGTSGAAKWLQSDRLGTRNALIIEDSYGMRGSKGHFVVTSNGIKNVVRHCVIRNSDLDVHGYCEQPRSGYTFEYYSNYIWINGYHYAANIRGGTGVFYSNHIDTSTCFGFYLQYLRAYKFGGCAYGGCVDVGSYPAQDQPGRGRNQRIRPIYQWSNTQDGKTVVLSLVESGETEGCGAQDSRDYIQKGRDFYDTTQMPGYVAYAYPHPLMSGTALCWVDSVGAAYDTGYTAGADTVVIKGSNFGASQGEGIVWIGDSTAASYVSWGATEIKVLTKSHDTGLVSVTVRPNNGDAYELDQTYRILQSAGPSWTHEKAYFNVLLEGDTAAVCSSKGLKMSYWYQLKSDLSLVDSSIDLAAGSKDTLRYTGARDSLRVIGRTKR
jgi:hypothetical protein